MTDVSHPNGSKVLRLLAAGACFVVIVAGMKAASSLLVLFLLATFLAVIVTPLFFSLQRKGISSPVALLILILGLILVSIITISVLGQALSSFSGNLESYQRMLLEKSQEMTTWLEAKGFDTAEEVVSDLLNPSMAVRFLGNTVSTISALLSQAFIILLVTIFMLFEAAMLPEKVRCLPGMSGEGYSRFQKVIDNIRHYMGLKTVMSLLTGILVVVWGAILGLNNLVLLGALAFVLNYVPNIGSFMAAIPGVVLALIQYNAQRSIVCAVGYVVINIAVSNGIEPRFMGKGLDLSPMIIVVSMIFWGWVLGPVGMLLSVPLTMAVKIVMESLEESRPLAMLMSSGPPRESEAGGEDEGSKE